MNFFGTFFFNLFLRKKRIRRKKINLVKPVLMIGFEKISCCCSLSLVEFNSF